MLFTVKQFAVAAGQPVKIVFTNPDATDHNLVIVKPGRAGRSRHGGQRDGQGPAERQLRFRPGEQDAI